MPAYSIRLAPNQIIEIGKAKRLRDAATQLRSKVSSGSYGDRELSRFWQLIEDAQLDLRASNTELAERAGLGSQFFSSVARDKRRPKLQNFLKAMTAIIDVANEHLLDAEKNGDSGAAPASFLLGRDELRLLAKSLAQLARNEIDKLDGERPNDPSRMAEFEKRRDILVIFANGFEKISSALEELATNTNEPIFAGRAKKIIDAVGNQINTWLSKNAAEAADWSIRIPVIAAGVAMLGLAGADMTVGTSAVAAIVGGEKVIKAIKR